MGGLDRWVPERVVWMWGLSTCRFGKSVNKPSFRELQVALAYLNEQLTPYRVLVSTAFLQLRLHFWTFGPLHGTRKLERERAKLVSPVDKWRPRPAVYRRSDHLATAWSPNNNQHR